MWFSSHSNVWSSVVSVAGNGKQKYIFNQTHASLYSGAVEYSHGVLFIPEQQLEVKRRTKTLESDSSLLSQPVQAVAS